jgi:hypothetical protein
LICAPDIHVRPYQGVSQHPANNGMQRTRFARRKCRAFDGLTIFQVWPGVLILSARQ